MIIIIEPECIGFAHEQVNAAFLYGYRMANPNEAINFYADKTHLECVNAILESANKKPNNTEYIAIKVPDSKTLRKIKTFFLYLNLFSNIFSKQNDPNNKFVLLSSNMYDLLAYKLASFLQFKRIAPTHVIVHGVLENVKKVNFRLHNMFRFGIKAPSNKTITYFVLSESIKENLKKYLPDEHLFFKAIDHPYILREIAVNKNKDKVVFATVGKGNPSAILKIVEEIYLQKTNDDFEIRLVGGGNGLETIGINNIRCIAADRRLTREEMNYYINDVHYIIFLYEQNSYELTASGAFFDAISYGKPIIFLQNKFINGYFKHYNFGYKCKDFKEISNLIISLSKNCDEKEYLHFVSEIMNMREEVSIEKTYHVLSFH